MNGFSGEFCSTIMFYSLAVLEAASIKSQLKFDGKISSVVQYQ
tara:strand:- start:157 stop:285 length:129 start_codon:yes stop_codon:yes gene_type:complete